MCVPQAIAAIGSLAGASEATIATMQTVGMIVSAAGTVAQGVAAYSAAKDNAAAYESQAGVKEAQAQQAARRGGYRSRLIAEKEREVAGAQRAALGGAGVDINTGSPLDLAADTAFKAGRDIGIEQYNAQLEQWGFNAEANALKDQAKATRRSGRNALVGSVLGAGASLLTGAGSVASRWSDMGRGSASVVRGAAIPRWTSDLKPLGYSL